MDEFLSLKKDIIYTSEIEINKSRFLGFSKYIETVEDAKNFVQKIKKDYCDARHVVYSYIVDGMVKSTDDGEPSGTAGRPILEFLLHKNCNHLVLVVVRYFGGVKLGTGGLLRAYQGSAKQTIEENLILYKRAKMYSGLFDYNQFKEVSQSLKNRSIKVLKTVYGEKIEFEVVCFDDTPILNMNYVCDVFESLGGENENN